MDIGLSTACRPGEIEFTYSHVPQTNTLAIGRRRRATILDHDAVPALIVRVGQSAQHALVRVDAREKESPRVIVLDVATQRLRLAPEP